MIFFVYVQRILHTSKIINYVFNPVQTRTCWMIKTTVHQLFQSKLLEAQLLLEIEAHVLNAQSNIKIEDVNYKSYAA